MESLIPDAENIFIGSIILVVILLAFVYQSKLEKLKLLTTIIIIGFFSFALSGEDGQGIIFFIVVAGFLIYVWNKTDKEKQFEQKKKILLDYNKDINAYGAYLELNPLGIEEIRPSSSLPFNKEELIKNSISFISLFDKDSQIVLLHGIPLLAYFRDNIPEKGYISNMGEFINNEEDVSNTINKLESGLRNELENLSNKLTKKNDFDKDLYRQCNEDSERILKLLKKSISI